MRINHIPFSLKALQLLKFSGLLEAQAQKLRWDAFKLINATIAGTATTNLWQLLESFFEVDEEPEEEELQDAASLTAAVHARKVEQEQEVAAKSLAITKSSVQAEEGVEEEEEEIEDTASTTSSQFTTPPVRTLSQIKESKKAMDKYPSKCELREAQLFFPASSEMMHQTGVDARYIGTCEKLSSYKGIYCCMLSDCDYGAQLKGIVYSHIHRVHLGVALGCRFCPEKCWLQACYWSIHMQSIHSQEPKFEPLVLPENIKAEPVESEVQITEERFEIPTPKCPMETEKEVETSKYIKQELDEAHTLQELAKSDDSHSYAFQSTKAHPQSAVTAIRYHKKPSIASQVASAIIMEDVVVIPETEEDESTDKEDLSNKPVPK